MIDFDADAKTTFRVRGGRYYIEPVSLEDAAAVMRLQKAKQQEQVAAMPELLIAKARSKTPAWWLRVTGRLSPQDAVRSLSAVQQARLFANWMSEFYGRGVGPGESSSSAD